MMQGLNSVYCDVGDVKTRILAKLSNIIGRTDEVRSDALGVVVYHTTGEERGNSRRALASLASAR